MKTKKKSNSRVGPQGARLPLGMQETHEVPKSRLWKKKLQNTFTAMETGQPDQDITPGTHNPLAVQGGLGPLNQEGEGERQNDQLAELEQIEPEE